MISESNIEIFILSAAAGIIGFAFKYVLNELRSIKTDLEDKRIAKDAISELKANMKDAVGELKQNVSSMSTKIDELGKNQIENNLKIQMLCNGLHDLKNEVKKLSMNKLYGGSQEKSL